MLRKTLYGTLAVSLLVLSARTADAQISSPIRFNVHAGAAIPVGSTNSSSSGANDGLTTGFRAGVGLELHAPLMPVGLRFDGDFDRLGFDGGGGNASIWSVTANAVLSPALIPIYFIGGVGFYSTKVNVDGVGSSNSETDFGFNLGAGLQLPLTGFSTFIEARYTRINTELEATQYIPIVFGVRF
jgi:opacity protein-like surface antigen